MLVPKMVSFTLTFACNLRCKMCGQWGQTGWFHDSKPPQTLPIDFWKGLVDQMDAMGTKALLLRGGEPLLYPGACEVIQYASSKGFFTNMDTNGTLLEKYASEILDSGLSALNLSIDGPEDVHDRVRGIPGTYRQIRENVAAFQAEEKKRGRETILRSFHCTLNPLNVASMPQLPATARDLNIPGFSTGPEYYVTPEDFEQHQAVYEAEYGEKPCRSGGFVRKERMQSRELLENREKMLEGLGGLNYEPYMNMTEQEYRDWLDNTSVEVGGRCRLSGLMMDIEPDGRANFCIDLADFSPGNARTESLESLFNNEGAIQFRRKVEEALFPACRRCGTRYMAQYF